jgi:hypothetical protein
LRKQIKLKKFILVGTWTNVQIISQS